MPTNASLAATQEAKMDEAIYNLLHYLSAQSDAHGPDAAATDTITAAPAVHTAVTATTASVASVSHLPRDDHRKTSRRNPYHTVLTATDWFGEAKKKPAIKSVSFNTFVQVVGEDENIAWHDRR